MVNAVDTPVSSVLGLVPAGQGQRTTPAASPAPAAPQPITPVKPIQGDASNGNSGTDASGSGGNGSGSNSNAGASAQTAFAAQVLAQQSDPSAASAYVIPSPEQAAQAYQTVESQTDPKNIAEVLLPGLPPRLASGRSLDLRV